jgi:hypothetical protein
MMIINQQAEKIFGNGDYSILEDGLRYRKKRRHKELVKLDEKNLKDLPEEIGRINLASNPLNNVVEEALSKGKKFKSSKGSKNIVNVINEAPRAENKPFNIMVNANDNNPFKPYEKKHCNNNINNNNTNTNNADIIMNNDNINIDTNIDNINLPHLKKINPCENENKILLQKELDRIKMSISKLENNFNQEHIPEIVRKLGIYCMKHAKNAKNLKIKGNLLMYKIFIFLVANLFSDEIFSIDCEKYSKKLSLINLEILFFDMLYDKNNLYENVLAMDAPNVGNLILFYYSQNCLIRVLKSFVPQIESNIEKVFSYI